MNVSSLKSCTAFNGPVCIASGDLAKVAGQSKKILEEHPEAEILIFDDSNSELIELDFRGTIEEVLQRIGKQLNATTPAPASESADSQELRGPGRPKLGVVAREVTLLPRHWDWLTTQPGGASVALRKLVERARRDYAGRDQIRQAQESSYKFMSAMAGNQPNFEEAIRALFAGNQSLFVTLIAPWPKDIQKHIHKLTSSVFGNIRVSESTSVDERA